MPRAARAELESLLQSRRLDHTLTSARLPAGAIERLATGLPDLDRHLDGGFPRGQLSELIGPLSSGRTSLLLQVIAAATQDGELAALIDGLDRFDPASAAAAGIALDRLLWVRGHLVSHPGFGRDLNQRALTQALEACALVLQSGGFGVVALDLGGVPAPALRRVPATTWLRLQRMVEGSQTVCVLLGEAPMARSTAGLTVKLGGARSRWDAPAAMPGEGSRARLFEGLALDVRAVHARTRWAESGGCVVEAAIREAI